MYSKLFILAVFFISLYIRPFLYVFSCFYYFSFLFVFRTERSKINNSIETSLPPLLTLNLSSSVGKPADGPKNGYAPAGSEGA